MRTRAESGDGPRRGRGGASRPALAAALAVALAIAPGARAAESGIEGVAALRGDFVAGVSVLVFEEPGPGPASAPKAVAAPTDDSGRYRISLAPGSYYVAAVRAGTPPWPFRGAPGDLFCYYLGNPIVVEPGRMTRVGFNMVRVGEPLPPERGEGAGVAGRVTFEGEPLGRAYVYVYRDATTNFRGMGLTAMPTDDAGRFRVKLPPGRYWLLARRRAAGGMYGPPGKDDHIGYLPGNPVEVRAGEFARVELETTTRVDLIEEIWFKEEAGAGWFEGDVTGPDGAPVPGLYVLFYTSPERTGAPAFVAGPTDAKGSFRVRAAAGTFHLLARSSLGGPLEPGEWHGTAVLPAGGKFAAGDARIRLSVSRYQGP